MTADKPPKFEKSLQELEKIVNQMESGDLPLDKSLDLFEKGIIISRQCQKSLELAEQRVESLINLQTSKDESE